MNEERQPLAGKILSHTNSSNQDTARLPRLQQEAPVIRPSGPDARLNLASAGMIATRDSQDVSAQLMLFCTIYTNYDHKPLAGVRKPAIPWDKFKGLASRGVFNVSQEEREGENEVLVCIYFETRGLVLILIMNSGICL